MAPSRSNRRDDGIRKVAWSTRVAAGVGAVFVAAFSLFLAGRASGSSSSAPATSVTTPPSPSVKPSPDAGPTGATAATSPPDTSPPDTLPPVEHVHTHSRGS